MSFEFKEFDWAKVRNEGLEKFPASIQAEPPLNEPAACLYAKQHSAEFWHMQYVLSRKVGNCASTHMYIERKRALKHIEGLKARVKDLEAQLAVQKASGNSLKHESDATQKALERVLDVWSTLDMLRSGLSVASDHMEHVVAAAEDAAITASAKQKCQALINEHDVNLSAACKLVTAQQDGSWKQHGQPRPLAALLFDVVKNLGARNVSSTTEPPAACANAGDHVFTLSNESSTQSIFYAK